MTPLVPPLPVLLFLRLALQPGDRLVHLLLLLLDHGVAHGVVEVELLGQALQLHLLRQQRPVVLGLGLFAPPALAPAAVLVVAGVHVHIPHGVVLQAPLPMF